MIFIVGLRTKECTLWYRSFEYINIFPLITILCISDVTAVFFTSNRAVTLLLYCQPTWEKMIMAIIWIYPTSYSELISFQRYLEKKGRKSRTPKFRIQDLCSYVAAYKSIFWRIKKLWIGRLKKHENQWNAWALKVECPHWCKQGSASLQWQERIT